MTAMLICLAVLLGGGTQVGLVADLLIELFSLPVLALSLFKLADIGGFRRWRFPVSIIGLIVLLSLLQLVPLPPLLWKVLPGADQVIAAFEASGVGLPWRPISLSPHATAYALFSMLPAAAIFLSVLSFNTRQRYALLIGPMFLGAISVLLGLAQLFGQDAKLLTFFQTAHVGYAIGFFANRNHFAALLYTLLPLTVVWTFGFPERRESRKFAALIFGAAIAGILLMGLSVAFSRAGATLGVVAAFASLPLVWRSRQISQLGRWTIVAGGACLLVFAILLQLGLVDLLLQRTTVDVQRDLFAETTIRAIGQLAGWGTGFGTFVPTYMALEPADEVLQFFVNHAHNDWLEVILEGGLPAAAIVALFCVWFSRRTWSAWHGGADDGWTALARAGSIAVVLLLLHSLLDYPLRTTALLALFSYCCAVLAPPLVKRARHENVGNSEAADEALAWGAS